MTDVKGGRNMGLTEMILRCVCAVTREIKEESR